MSRQAHNAPFPLSLPAALVYLLTVASLWGCSGSDALLAPLPQDAKVLAFGDSLTFGTGASAAASYPAALAGLTGLEVIRSGVPGEVSATGRKRLVGVLRDVQPDLVLLLHGGNDILRRQSLADLEANLAAMIESARDAGAQVMLIAVPGRSITLSPPPLYEELAQRYQVPLVDDVLPDLLLTPSMKSDPIHLNAEGYAALATAIADRMRELGAIGD
ncbi:MAG: GDSL-type esterase/lipase family protein [Pseudomonadaceae bacterium]|nr:GDSL-type esterase/lipase family protein [Pseudomonadaceae bacterium]